MIEFNLNSFIKKYVTQRDKSLFENDIIKNKKELESRINGKSVLVIGGAGTIGSSFIKAILPFRPGKLVVVDYNENGLTELTRDLRSEYNELMPTEYVTYPFDFGGSIFSKMYKDNYFDIVASFAAHKHVRSEKDHLAIEAMIFNNVFNTRALLEQSLLNKPEHIFAVSTDKAANPVNVMGASKKMMENVLMAYADDLKISTARFANVAFSNGSLPFGFIQRIMKRQPLSAPNDVKRYFVSPLESGQLCMLACILGESKDIFFPKLIQDQMLTFSKIAEDLLSEFGLEPDYCSSEEEARNKANNWNPNMNKYPVYFFKTDTSGEKSFEEFYTESDIVKTDVFEELGVIKNKSVVEIDEINTTLDEFVNMFKKLNVDKKSIVELMTKYISDFKHIETGKSLDQKM